MPISAVISANIDYWQDEAVKLACKQLGIPFLVLCRENYTIPWTIPWHHNHLAKAGFKFNGTGVAVFSESTKGALAPAVANSEDIWVTGAPRYDRWLRLKNEPNVKKTKLCLITFNEPGYMATNTFLEVTKIFDSAARSGQGLGQTWIVKCKKRSDRLEVLSRLNSLSDSPLQFEYDTPLFELFPYSRVVVGYNSLALLEALLTDAPVIVPCWGETRAPRRDLLLDYDDPLNRRVITFAKSPEELADLLRRAAQGLPLLVGSIEDRRAVFRAHIHDPSEGDDVGTASEKVEEFVKHYIAKSMRIANSIDL